MAFPNSQERYVNFYTDFAFKKLFGTEANKELLISFLNSMFDGQEGFLTSNTSTWSCWGPQRWSARPSSTSIAATSRATGS